MVKRPGKLKALVALARSTPVIAWHLLGDPALRYQDPGSGYYAAASTRTAKPAAMSAGWKPSATP
jgi:hypothetical protein